LTQLPTLSPFSPLGSVLNDIQRAIDAKLYYPALLVALTVPEICEALLLDRKDFLKLKHYARFVDKYTTPATLGLDGVSCYRLRGGIVHRANLVGHPEFGATHVIFTIPESGSSLHAFSITHTGSTARAAMFDLVKFCMTMKQAAEQWYEDNRSNPRVTESMGNIIRYCPLGVAPYCTGAPVIASGT
jgi:hypothetical protein